MPSSRRRSTCCVSLRFLWWLPWNIGVVAENSKEVNVARGHWWIKFSDIVYEIERISILWWSHGVAYCDMYMKGPHCWLKNKHISPSPLEIKPQLGSTHTTSLCPLSLSLSLWLKIPGLVHYFLQRNCLLHIQHRCLSYCTRSLSARFPLWSFLSLHLSFRCLGL